MTSFQLNIHYYKPQFYYKFTPQFYAETNLLHLHKNTDLCKVIKTDIRSLYLNHCLNLPVFKYFHAYINCITKL